MKVSRKFLQEVDIQANTIGVILLDLENIHCVTMTNFEFLLFSVPQITYLESELVLPNNLLRGPSLLSFSLAQKPVIGYQ